MGSPGRPPACLSGDPPADLASGAATVCARGCGLPRCRPVYRPRSRPAVGRCPPRRVHALRGGRSSYGAPGARHVESQQLVAADGHWAARLAQIRWRAGRGPCADGRRESIGPPGSASAAGSRASCCGGDCWVGMCALSRGTGSQGRQMRYGGQDSAMSAYPQATCRHVALSRFRCPGRTSNAGEADPATVRAAGRTGQTCGLHVREKSPTRRADAPTAHQFQARPVDDGLYSRPDCC